MAASSSSFKDHQIKHDVFISFRGEDVRCIFLCHLVSKLRREKIIVYVDENLNRGDEISSSLLRAIQQSQISIVIFSENYASSRWCLDELEEIIERMKGNKQIVLPVFYNIDPSHVRNQEGTYKKAFAEHELKFQGKGLKLQNWRSALKDAAAQAGYVANHYSNDSELIDEIAKDVLLRLDHVYPGEPKGLVGIDRHIDRIRSFLEKESKEVQVLGIWGMSGIGKTTIAQVAYDKFSHHFEGSCFLDNVREESQKHGLKSLKQKLISELLEDKSSFVQKRLISRRKVFVVLDDVGTPEQLHHLATEGICWGPGSRVIVTSQNKQALIAGGVHAIHEVKELDSEESLKLFSLNAFKNSHPEKGYEELSKRAVGYAKGLPLALKVLSLCLYSGDRETWKDTLRKLDMYPHPQIQDVLKTSYDGLDDVEKDIFLDIAFFYKGEDKDHVMSLLDANNLFPACGIKGLLDKALISVSNDNIIEMHDLIQEMGWEIVHQECMENPRKRSRLKDFDAYDVLKNNKETDAIKGVVLSASLIKDLQWSIDTLNYMTNLRVIKFYFSFQVGSCTEKHPTIFESFFDNSRNLDWNGHPPRSSPLNFDHNKCVEHCMPNSENEKLLQDYDISRSPHLSKPSVELLEISKHESCINVNPHNLSVSLIIALNVVHSKGLKTLLSDGSRNDCPIYCCSVKEFPLSSEDISEPDLGASKLKMRALFMGRPGKPRTIILGGSREEILPIQGLYCRQRISQNPALRILFELLNNIQDLGKSPDSFSSESLAGSCIVCFGSFLFALCYGFLYLAMLWLVWFLEERLGEGRVRD